MTPLVPKLLRIALLTLTATLLAALALAQTANPLTHPCKPTTTQHKPSPTHEPAPCGTNLHPETSLSLGAFPQLTAIRINDTRTNFNTESLSASPGVLGTFRQSFRPWLGYSVNMGYTRASEHFTDNAGFGSAGTASNFSVPANVYELSLSYLAERHLSSRLTGFTDIGAGMVSLLPVHRGATAADFVPFPALVPSVSFRPLGVGGVGIDYLITPHLGLRAEYRGQLFKYAGYGNGLPNYLTVTSEPTLSLLYNFHATKP